MIEAWKAPLDKEAGRAAEVKDVFGKLSIIDLQKRIAKEEKAAM